MWHQLNKPKMERLFCVRQLYSTLLLSTQVYNGIIRPIERNLLQNASRNLHMSSIPSGVGGRGEGGGGRAVVGYSMLFYSTEGLPVDSRNQIWGTC